MRQRKARLWPREEDLRELDECIYTLARTLRSKRKLTHDDAILLVDKKWPKMHLQSRIQNLLQAALLPDGAAPAAPEGVIQWKAICDQARQRGPNGRIAAEFVKMDERLRQQKIKPSEVKWDRFYELLKGENATIHFPGNIAISSYAAAAYTKYLEIEHDYWLWNDRFEKWRAANAEREPFYAWIERNDILDSRVDETHLAKSRQAARDRQRHRRKKIRQEKRDRKRAESSDEGQPIGDLRDARI